jgi:hypothetical protein
VARSQQKLKEVTKKLEEQAQKGVYLSTRRKPIIWSGQIENLLRDGRYVVQIGIDRGKTYQFEEVGRPIHPFRNAVYKKTHSEEIQTRIMAGNRCIIYTE